MPSDEKTPAKSNGNGTVKLWGIPIDKIVSIIQGVGVPTALILFGCFMLYRYVPPVVNGHVKLLATTEDTLKAMETLIREIAADTQDDRLFRQEVHAEHLTHEARLVELCETIRAREYGEASEADPGG